VNELIRGFRPQSGIRRRHRKDVEVDIEIKCGRFCLSVPTALIANVREEDSSRSARDYIRTLCEWLSAGRKDLDCLDPYGCIEPESGKVRATGRLESAPF
jgi:hypothetical protein